MIPIDLFMVMVGAVFVLAIYSWIDHNNKVYANIIAAFLSAILAGFCSTVVSTDTVYDAWYCTYNTTSFGHNCQEVIFNSPSYGFALGFVSFVMFVYTIYMLWGAYEEHKAYKAQVGGREE
jgi:uncharacterized membrane protein